MKFLAPLLAVSFVAACGGDGSTSVDPALDAVTEHLCLASVTDSADDMAAHFDQAHDGLHLLARQVAEIDRGASASLLEAKQAFEQAVVEGADADRLRPMLELLLVATDDALALLDGAPRLACVS